MGAAGETPDLGVYLHVPFCERVCPYCDFSVEAVGTLDPDREDAYVRRLLAELELARPGLGRRTLATVYLGGGTPSLLRPGSVERLLAALVDAFDGEPSEVTLELNPGVVEVERLPAFRAAGVTRVSVGVQSLCDSTLRRLGRAHRALDAHRGLEACLAAGFDSVSADLIWAAPRQTEEGVQADLGALLELAPPHVSAYELTLEPGTPLEVGARRGVVRVPDEDARLRMSRRVRSVLAGAGLEQYEISSFARPGHRSRHNERYWRRRDVLGLGVSAASHVGAERRRNARDSGQWARALDAGRLPVEEAEGISEHDARRETLYLGLRRIEGVSRAAYLREFGAPPECDFPRELDDLRQLGLICDSGGQLRLTERGILFSDEVFLRFVGR